MIISVCNKVEYVVEKLGKNADNQHFLIFPLCFRKPSLSNSQGCQKLGFCGKGLSLHH